MAVKNRIEIKSQDDVVENFASPFVCERSKCRSLQVSFATKENAVSHVSLDVT